MTRLTFRWLAMAAVCVLCVLSKRAAAGELAPVWPEIQAQFGDELKDFADVFRALYSEDIVEASKTPGTIDDVGVAKRLVSTAEGTDQKPLQALLCQYAYIVGLSDARGHEHAEAAMQLLIKATPAESQGPWKLKLADLMKLRMEAVSGEDKTALGKRRVAMLVEVAEAHTQATRHEQAATMYEQAIEASRAINDIPGTLELKKRHDAALGDAIAKAEAQAKAQAEAKMKAERERARMAAEKQTAAETSMWAAIIEQDDPAATLPHTADAGLPQVAELVALAAKPPSSLPTDQSVRLGKWYAELVDRAEKAEQKMALLLRAWRYTHNGDPNAPSLAALTKQITDRGYPEVDLYASPLPAVERLPETVNKVGMRLVRVPAGSFDRGSEPDEVGRDEDETLHTIRLTESYYIGVTEVTQLQWKQVMGSYPSNFKGDGLPVENITWTQAMEFGRKLSELDGRAYRLPSEAEWEYACRAGGRGLYANGARVTELAWYDRNSDSKTHAVGGRGPNAWGLHDMHGNVAEWCWDVYADYPADGAAQTNPSGPRSGSEHVVRGGSWRDTHLNLRCADRAKAPTDTRASTIGFRVVIDPFVKSGGSGRVTFFGIGK